MVVTIMVVTVTTMVAMWIVYVGSCIDNDSDSDSDGNDGGSCGDDNKKNKIC
jgi:hypothetical protein